jgi:hypothetical protein
MKDTSFKIDNKTLGAVTISDKASMTDYIKSMIDEQSIENLLSIVNGVISTEQHTYYVNGDFFSILKEDIEAWAKAENIQYKYNKTPYKPFTYSVNEGSSEESFDNKEEALIDAFGAFKLHKIFTGEDKTTVFTEASNTPKKYG